MESRLQPTQKGLQDPVKVLRNRVMHINKLESCKEDYPSNSQENTSHKCYPPKEHLTLNKNTTIFKNIERADVRMRQRRVTINMYSKMQDYFLLSMESLFLAIDVLDKYMDQCNEQLNIEECSKVSLACFMLAIKYEEIYPPSFENVSSKMKLQVDFIDYVNTEFKILKVLDFNLVMSSPVEYFENFPFEMTPEKKSFIFLNLELAAMKIEIKKMYSWEQIMKAIQILFLPLSQTERIPADIKDCFCKLSYERPEMIDNQSYFWLNRKYSDSKFHEVAKKPFYIGEDN